jgi:hypothetical protein
MTAAKVKDSLRCWTAHSKYADTVVLRRNILSGLLKKESIIAYLAQDVLTN